ncbi:recombinase family protein [Cetobacterium sp. SF1]|uniref:recombinase family protein n=1 Tax=Cetobacterium sp. SF1 TaxID=3417654 RepID=UPI003CE8DC3E
MNKKVALYLRYSSENQRDESIDAQQRASEEYCKKHGYIITKIYIDKAKSATTDKRPEFQKMIRDSEHEDFEIILVHKLDRFARDKYDSALYKKKLKNNGVKVISITENLDDSPESIILESVIEGMAEYYSKNLAREVMKGLVENAYQCKHTGGRPPLGYDIDDNKKYIINEKEAEAVKLIFQMYIDDYTSGDMIRKLNKLGFRTKKGSNWTKNSLTSIVRNEKYTGVYIYNRSAKKNSSGSRNNHKNKDNSEIIRIEGGIPKIIEKELFEKVQEKLKARKKSLIVRTKTMYLLSGIVKCSCGSSMHGNKRRAKRRTNSGLKEKPEYISYRCGCRKNKSSIICDNPEIRKEYLEEYILNELENSILEPNIIEALSEKVNNYLNEDKQNIAQMKEVSQKELAEIDIKIKNIINAISMGFTSIELKNELDELNQKKYEINNVVSNLNKEKDSSHRVTPEDVKEQLINIRKFILERNYPEIRTFIKNFVKEIIVSKEGIEVTFIPLFSFVKHSEFQLFRSIKRENLYDPLKRCLNMKINKKKEEIKYVFLTNCSNSWNNTNNNGID